MVVDGLGPTALEAAIEGGRADLRQADRARHVPSRRLGLPLAHARLSLLDRHGRQARTSMGFRTSSGTTAGNGASSSTDRPSARCAAGIGQTMRDALVNMNARHLSPRATTVFEALEDAGFVTAAVNSRSTAAASCIRRRSAPRSVARPAPFLLLQPVGVRPHGRSAVMAAAGERIRGRLPRPPPRIGSSPGTASTFSCTTCRTTTTPRTPPDPQGHGRPSAVPTPPSPISQALPAVWTSSSTATPSSCSPTTGRPPFARWLRCSPATWACRARS